MGDVLIFLASHLLRIRSDARQQGWIIGFLERGLERLQRPILGNLFWHLGPPLVELNLTIWFGLSQQEPGDHQKIVIGADRNIFLTFFTFFLFCLTAVSLLSHCCIV